MELAEDLLEILACPRCKGSLQIGDGILICSACRVYYPVRDGIPVLLVDEATKIDKE